MAKFQVTGKKLPKNGEGKLVFAAGSVVEADSMADLGVKYPSLIGKVSRMLEVATPEADEAEAEAEAEEVDEIAKLKADIKEAGGKLPGGKASVEKLEKILAETLEA